MKRAEQNLAPQTDAATDSSPEIHAPFQPEPVRPGDALRAEIAPQGSGNFRAHPVWRVSPLGIEIVVDEKDTPFGFSDKVDLLVKYGDAVISHAGLVVSQVLSERGKKLIAVRWIDEERARASSGEKRASNRWLCGQEYLPTGVVSNPLQFNDFIHFRITELSRTGMKIRTSLRNKLIVPGMLLEGMVTFPLVGQSNVIFEVVHPRIARENGKDYLELGCKFRNPAERLHHLIAQYLLQFGPAVSPEDLRRENLIVGSVNQAVTFSNVRTEEDYKKVLELRRLAWVHSGKVQEVAEAQSFADVYDARARILTASYKGEIVASLRLVFPQQNEKLEHEQYITLPENLPRLDELVEITRVVVHPDYRGVDLLYLLFKHTALTCLQAGKRYILGNSEPKLLPLYEKLGFKVLPVEFEIKKLGIRPRLFLGDIHQAVAGIGVNPIVWNLMYADLVKHIAMRDIMGFGPGANIRMASLRLLKPLSVLIASRIKRRKPAPRPA